MESNSEMAAHNKFMSLEDMNLDIQFNHEHKHEILRILSQYLQENGLEKSARMLEEESGVHLEGELIQKFRQLVIEGEFDEVVKL